MDQAKSIHPPSGGSEGSSPARSDPASSRIGITVTRLPPDGPVTRPRLRGSSGKAPDTGLSAGGSPRSLRVLVAGHSQRDEFTAVTEVNHAVYDPAHHSFIAATRGYIRAMSAVIPDLNGRLDCQTFLMPSQAVSALDFVLSLEKGTALSEVVAALPGAAASPALRGILEVNEEPLVSRDFRHHPSSCVVDLPLTELIGGDLLRLAVWHDAEWAYTCRVAQLLRWMVEREG